MSEPSKKHGLKPILGCEAYVAGDKGRKEDVEKGYGNVDSEPESEKID